MAILITGAAGFIGSNLIKAFLMRGEKVLGIDNLCRGSLENIKEYKANPNFSFVEVDMFNLHAYKSAISSYSGSQNLTAVWHMAANSDIPAGIANANIDLRDTLMTTFNTLEIMKDMQIKTIAFASSSAIYGDHGDTLLVESLGPLLPISNYGAMKLASEAIISAAAESFLDQAFIFRFPNVIGTPATHGVMLDFIRRLQKSPDKLVVLGNGTQQKGYLHVEELIDAMFFVANNPKERIEVMNIGSDDGGASVRFIAEETIRLIAPTATVAFGDENRGWVGDVPKFTYSIDKLKNYGWTPKLGSREAIKKALKQIKLQEMGN